MRTFSFTLLIVFTIILFSSCRNKTVVLLSKKWDCVKIENLDLGDPRFQSQQDSLSNIQLQSVLESLNWTFSTNGEYECAVAGNVTINGTYELLDKGKTLVCTPETKNSINRYTINSLTEYSLVLSSATNNSPLVLHFKPH